MSFIYELFKKQLLLRGIDNKLLSLALIVAAMMAVYKLQQYLKIKIDPRNSFKNLLLFGLINLMIVFVIVVVSGIIIIYFNNFFFKK